MTMTAEEIVRHWRQSKRTPEEITVLADLNSVSQEEIRKILTDAGELLPVPRKSPRRMDPVLARQLYDAGMTDDAIAGQLGVKASTVGTWRRQNDLRVNRPPAETPPENARPAVWEQISAILSALPDSLNIGTRKRAKDLLMALFGEYLEEVLPDDRET